jgi:uncharacterized protein
MILDVSQLIQNDGAVKELDFCVESDNISINGQDIVFETPFYLKGAVKNIAGVLYLDLGADVSFKTQCARCLDSVSVHHTFEVSEVFSKTEVTDSEDEVTVIDSGNIDMDEVVIKAFIGTVPINYLCSDDCKGLCKQCGCNLNKETCSCEDDNIDPRLAVLKQFLKD